MKEYNKEYIPLAKCLRKNMTPWERKLWYNFLRNYPVRFQRQKAIGNYIVDFYCAKARLVIEIDGGGHYSEEQARKDAERTKELETKNLNVVRFCNLDIDRNFNGVCEHIDRTVKKSLPQSASLTAPSSEGAISQCIYALGFFDGVHLGHQALLSACRKLARENACKAGAVTFTTHPLSVVAGEAPKLINTPDDRKTLLTAFAMDEVVEIPFDKALMSIDWRVFLDRLREEYNAAGFVCGDDFRFGYHGEGTAERLLEYCKDAELPCAVVPEQKIGETRVSSTHIRALLEQGDLKTANAFLGHPHILTGKVVSGKHLGTTLGTPTANLQIPQGVAVPKFGVYACRAYVEGESYLAVTNIGTRPTVSGEGVTVEAWLLDFEGDLYGKELTLAFYDFLRQEKKFDTLEKLQEEILENALQTRKLLENC